MTRVVMVRFVSSLVIATIVTSVDATSVADEVAAGKYGAPCHAMDASPSRMVAHLLCDQPSITLYMFHNIPHFVQP